MLKEHYDVKELCLTKNCNTLLHNRMIKFNQPHKMVKHTQTICRLMPTNYLIAFDHFVRLAVKVFENNAVSNAQYHQGESF